MTSDDPRGETRPVAAELQARTDAALRGAPHAICGQLWVVSGPGRLAPYAP